MSRKQQTFCPMIPPLGSGAQLSRPFLFRGSSSLLWFSKTSSVGNRNSGDSWFSQEFAENFFQCFSLPFRTVSLPLRTLLPRKYGWYSRSLLKFRATCERTYVIRRLKMSRANSRVFYYMKIYSDISSYSNNCNNCTLLCKDLSPSHIPSSSDIRP